MKESSAWPSNILLDDGNVTDAYGEIEFIGTKDQTISKFIKVGTTTPPEKVLQVMTKQWKMKIPNLIISVTGGAKNFKMKSNLTKIFRKSLIKAAESTGSWIVSGGTNTGVMLHVGKAVRQYAHVTKNQSLVALGIATWGTLHNRDQLIKQNFHGPNPVLQYELSKPPKGLAALDKNHSHFILVDDGTENEYGKEIKFRAAFEAYLSQQKSIGGVRVLNVCLMVQGGPNSLVTAYNALKQDIPVVIVGNSGGWASVLQTCYYKNPTDLTEVCLRGLLSEQGMQSDDLKPQVLSRWTNLTRECIKMKDNITIFETEFDEDSIKNLDVAILKSLLTNASNINKVDEQLKLCIAWNRCDLARSYIFEDDSWNITKGSLKSFFIESFVMNSHEFIDLFFEFGFNRRLSKDEILDIYKSVIENTDTNSLLSKLSGFENANHSDFSYNEVSKIAKILLGQSFISIYETFYPKELDKSKNVNYSSKRKLFKSSFEESTEVFVTSQCRTFDGMKELYFLSLLMNWKEMSYTVWKVLRDQLTASVAGFRVLKAISKTSFVEDEAEVLISHMDMYRSLTLSLLDECYSDDRSKTCDVITRCVPVWGQLTCLQMMVDSRDVDLVSHSSVQYLLNEVWFGGMKQDTNLLRVAACCAMPALVPLIIKFEPVKEQDKVAEPEVETIESIIEANKNDYTYIKQIKMFYKSPVVSFGMNTFSYLLFLLLFSIVLLFNLPTSTSAIANLTTWEIVLFIWVCCLALDEVNEFAARKRDKHIIKRFVMWFGNIWNMLDLMGLCVYTTGFILRFYSMNWSRILLSVAFVVYCVRLLQIFTIHRLLGPKIIMVGKMVKDMIFFMFILLVFLIAYGVVRQSLLYPDENRIGTNVIGVFNKPYWNLYGELFLEEIDYNPNSDDLSCSTVESDIISGGSDRCPQVQSAVPVFSAIYLLFANVLLLNLLIAMFTYSFDNLVDNSDKIWKLQLFELIEEYYYKPFLCTPLSVINHVISFMKFLSEPLWKNKRVGNSSRLSRVIHDTFKRNISNDNHQKLNLWIKWRVESSLITEANKGNAAIKVEKITERIDNLAESVEALTGSLKNQKQIKRKVKSLEQTMVAMNEALQWIITALNDNSTHPKLHDDEVHVKSRQSPYPNSEVVRFQVEPHLVSWTVPYPEYDPPDHTDRIVLSHPEWADPGIDGNRFHFNSLDGDVDRTSHLGKYQIVGGFPRNPRGRTGLKGRGLLGRYGPNHAADPIVTRWKMDEFGNFVLVDEKKVLEFIAVKRNDTGDWAIPGGMVDPGERFTKTLKREFLEEVELNFESEEDKESIKNKIDDFLKFDGVEVFRGYCDDYRNTDVSWIETVVMNFHDEKNEIFQNVKLQPGDESRKVKWKRIGKKLKLFASHSTFLEMVAKRHDAHF